MTQPETLPDVAMLHWPAGDAMTMADAVDLLHSDDANKATLRVILAARLWDATVALPDGVRIVLADLSEISEVRPDAYPEAAALLDALQAASEARVQPFQADPDVLGTGTRILGVVLTDPERLVAATDLGEALAELDLHTDEEADIKASLKATRLGMEARIRVLRRVVTSGEVRRSVTVVTRADWQQGNAITRRLDTGAEVETRALNTDERQAALFPTSQNDQGDLDSYDGELPPEPGINAHPDD